MLDKIAELIQAFTALHYSSQASWIKALQALISDVLSQSEVKVMVNEKQIYTFQSRQPVLKMFADIALNSSQQIQKDLGNDHFISAIRELRHATGLSLKDSKAIIDHGKDSVFTTAESRTEKLAACVDTLEEEKTDLIRMIAVRDNRITELIDTAEGLNNVIDAHKATISEQMATIADHQFNLGNAETTIIEQGQELDEVKASLKATNFKLYEWSEGVLGMV
jgi:ribosomal protein L7/L12